MNVLLINHYFVPPTEPGGTRHYLLAQKLNEFGHKVDILASDFNHFSSTYIKQDNTISTPNLNVHFIKTPSYIGNSLSRVKNMLVFSYKILKGKQLSKLRVPDVVIGSSPHLFAAFSAYLLSRRFKVPFVLEVRDIWPESLVQVGNMPRWHPLVLVFKVIEKHLYKKANVILTLPPHANNYITKYKISEHKIHPLPNFVDFENIPKVNNVTKDKTFTFFYSGSFGKANHLSNLIDALKICEKNYTKSSFKLIMAGDGPLKKEFLKKAEAVSNIEVIDAVAKKELYHLLAKADAYIVMIKDIPLYQYGISFNKLFDYMAMARPILCCGKAYNNPVELAEAGLTVDSNRPEEIANSMMSLMDMDKEDLTKMGLAGLNYAKEHHDLNKIGRKLNTILIDAIEA